MSLLIVEKLLLTCTKGFMLGKIIEPTPIIYGVTTAQFTKQYYIFPELYHNLTLNDFMTIDTMM